MRAEGTYLTFLTLVILQVMTNGRRMHVTSLG